MVKKLLTGLYYVIGGVIISIGCYSIYDTFTLNKMTVDTVVNCPSSQLVGLIGFIIFILLIALTWVMLGSAVIYYTYKRQLRGLR